MYYNTYRFFFILNINAELKELKEKPWFDGSLLQPFSDLIARMGRAGHRGEKAALGDITLYAKYSLNIIAKTILKKL